MLKPILNTGGISYNAPKQNYKCHTQGNIIQSVAHAILIPAIIALASPVNALVYFAFAMVAYSTIFRDRSSYFFGIVKTVAIAAFALSAWIFVMGFVASLGASL